MKLFGKNHKAFSNIKFSRAYREIGCPSVKVRSSYRMPQATFNSIYKAFSEDVGNGDSRYFTSSDYTTFFNAIPELIQ